LQTKSNKTALVVGAMGGIGKETVHQLAKKGWIVFAADIDERVLRVFESEENITPVQLDVSDQESVDKAYEFVGARTDGLDAIINMAGVLRIGAMVEMPISDLQYSMEINLFGVFRVNKRFLPMVMKQKGRIIMLSSEVGTQNAAPFNGAYAATKHALEAYSDALRRELGFLGIYVIKIQPGPIKSEMTRGAERLFVMAEQDSRYFKKNISKGMSYLPKVYRQASQPVLVVKAIVRALESSHPRTAYPVKRDLFRRLVDYLPVRWADWLIKTMLS
jgi:NAD(P)-dependent dehydrogenase (short-subunit alcohol dehydrogenase family)